MTHELKIIDKYYNAILNGRKRFELRKNNRNFKVGDTLILKEIDKNGDETGEYLKRRITYILQDCSEYGLKEGYCILSFDFMWDV